MEKICKDCLHFRLHYVKFLADDYSPTNCGHCIEKRIKRKQATQKACKYWQQKRDKSNNPNKLIIS